MAEQPKLKNPFTPEGFAKLADEYDWLFHTERPKVVRGVADAAAEGDRSENAEYIYGKKRLREIDKRLRYLSSLLKDAQVIRPLVDSTDVVLFGNRVTVEDEAGEQRTFRIVGLGEAGSSELVSWQSPVGRSLLGKKVGDVIVIERPAGDWEIEILKIEVMKGDG